MVQATARRLPSGAPTVSGPKQEVAPAEGELSAAQWKDYEREGFIHLGQVLDGAEVEALCSRVDDLALGRITGQGTAFQLDTGGRYDDLPPAVESLDTGTLLYRKVQGLESDDLFGEVLRRPLFRHIAARHYGPHSPVSLFRAMVMNKPAGQGTLLPWHQDGGDVWALDRDPLVTIWIALDRADAANGGVQVLPGSHRLGLLTQEGSTVTPEDAERHCQDDRVHQLEVPAGHGVLLHNWLIHRSGVNPTSSPRRAFTACYMDGRTCSTLTGDFFPMVFGEVTRPHAQIALLTSEREHYRVSAESAREYALSLLADNERLHQELAAATVYARSLEAARLQADL